MNGPTLMFLRKCISSNQKCQKLGGVVVNFVISFQNLTLFIPSYPLLPYVRSINEYFRQLSQYT